MFEKFYAMHFQVAYRNNKAKPWTLINNPSFGWVADPFVIKYKGETYIFAEIFLYKTERNGVIGYCKLEDGVPTDWKVTMDKHYHLSFPNVWIENDELYMCPESYQNDEVAIYRLIEFPDRWEKVDILMSNKKCVDTVFLENGGKQYCFTYELSEDRKSDSLIRYEMNKKTLENPEIVYSGVETARPGGKFFKAKGKIYRVAQNGEGGYGRGLIIYEVTSLDKHYKEEEVRRIYTRNVKIANPNGRKFIGLHTYNRCEEIEVIDFKYRQYSLTEYFARKRTTKIFVNKF